MRPFLVLGREELLGQLTNVKKKQAQSETIINQLRAENQRWVLGWWALGGVLVYIMQYNAHTYITLHHVDAMII